MFRAICFLGILMICFAACQPLSWNKQVKGLTNYNKGEFWYEWIGKNSAAPKPQVGEEVRIDYTLQKGNQVLDNSFDNAYPILVQIPEARYDNFFTKALKLMGEGDSLRLLIPAKNIPDLLGDYVNEFGDNELVTFTYNMRSIKSLEVAQQEILQEQRYLDSIRRTIPVLIEQFKDSTLANVHHTKSGLSYIIFDKGTGAQAQVGSLVNIHYICFLPTGRIVDDSYTNMVPISFEIGSQSLIEGWSEGAALLQQGGKAVLFIPPHLAYGAQGNGDVIPPNSWVVFYIEMKSVQK